MNSCGDCNLCCELLGVVEYEKPANTFCQYCPNGVGGCQNYAGRPKTCREFECGWLNSRTPVDFRPDRIHIIVTGEDKKLRVQFLHIDPRYPDAMKSPRGAFFVRLLRQYGFPDLSVTTGDKWEVISDNPVRAAMIRHELESRT
jgi:hypothetical protein